jgi:hypothetical protein
LATKVVTFNGVPPPGTINFGVGQPSADLLPVEDVREAMQSFLAEAFRRTKENSDLESVSALLFHAGRNAC